jgi:hypothetical protein
VLLLLLSRVYYTGLFSKEWEVVAEDYTWQPEGTGKRSVTRNTAYCKKTGKRASHYMVGEPVRQQ